MSRFVVCAVVAMIVASGAVAETRESAFAKIYGPERGPVPEAGRLFGEGVETGMTVTDTLHRFAGYRLTAQGQATGSLQLQPGRGFRTWNAYNASGALTGSIGGWAGQATFSMRDARGTLVGLLSHPNSAPPGELHVYDLQGNDVGALCDMSGDGGVISVRGGNGCAAVFARIGLKVIPPGI